MNEMLNITEKIHEPIKANIQSLFNHFGRYWYAIKKLEIGNSDKVVDFGCGLGYGTYLLSLYAMQATGIDSNPDYVREATKLFGEKYYDPDILETIGCFEYFDKAVCIEVIEHVEQAQQNEIVRRLASWIKPGGMLYLTFPEGKNQKSKYNPFHLCEPSIKDVGTMFLHNGMDVKYEQQKILNTFGYTENQIIMWGKKCNS